MDQENYTTRHQKGKHLNYDERMTIQLRLKDGWSPYRIAKELGYYLYKGNNNFILMNLNCVEF